MHKTINDIIAKKGRQKISVVTSYDYAMTTLCDQVDILLVGDSAGMVMLGYENTAPVTMEQMCMFTEAVSNGRQNALIVADLPNKSYENEVDAVSNSERLINAGADAVKLEGRLPDVIGAIVKAGIPVMGHLGLLPQTAKKYTVQGKTEVDVEILLNDAKALQEAGVFSIVLEMVTSEATKKITGTVSVPTIGIGCGQDCDGQVLVIHDMLGLFEKLKPKFVKRYLSLSEEIKKAVSQYVKDVVDNLIIMMTKKSQNGLYNLGSGKARTFNDLVNITFNAMNLKSNISYIETPIDIRDKYQYFTQANLDKLRRSGYKTSFTSLENGIMDYVNNYLIKKKYF